MSKKNGRPKDRHKSTSTTFRFQKKIKEMLLKVAKKEKRTQTAIIEIALERYFVDEQYDYIVDD